MTDRAALVPLVDRLADASVLCVGDVMLDRFVSGTVERISPEAPIPVFRVGRQTAMLGGAGNVMRNLVSLGARAHFVGVLGDDGAGAEVRTQFGALPGVTADLIGDCARCTSIKTRYLAGGQQMMRADEETVRPLDEQVRAALMAAVRGALDAVSVVVLSDYGKGVLADGVAADIIALARDAQKTVIVDPKGSDYTCYRGASLITPNRKELAEAARMATDGDAAVAGAARSLIKACGVEAVLATRSQEGMSLVYADGPVRHLPAEAREVFDVSGAGDTVVATVAAAVAAGAELASAAALANVAAGIVVGKVGTAAVRADDLVGALHHQDISDAEARVVTLEQAHEQVERWRARGHTVGFTNGCFDLIHPGHVSLLAQARAACDRLVVGLNSDASVKRLKGESRPVQGEAARATVLSSLAGVDLVVVFGEDTPLALIEALRPDVLVKGADYAIDEVVGADVVQGYGGRVVLAELTPGQSTTGTIARMR